MELSFWQRRVWTWCKETFEGIVNWNDPKERAFRFLEESLELFQAMGYTKDDALFLVDYVFNRSIGSVPQEIGGVMITLLALGANQGLEVERCMLEEYLRINRIDIRTQIREKQLSKKQALV